MTGHVRVRISADASPSASTTQIDSNFAALRACFDKLLSCVRDAVIEQCNELFHGLKQTLQITIAPM